MKDKLPPDATMRTVVLNRLLRNPGDYVRIVTKHANECQSKHGNASVRIGVQGGGVEPWHRIEYTTGLSSSPSVFSAYKGGTDTKIPLESLKDEHWSTAAITYEDFKKLRTEANL